MASSAPGASSGKRWSPHADDKLRMVYPKYPRADILKMFPGRTWRSIKKRALVLGVQRKILYIRKCQKESPHPLTAQLRQERVSRGYSTRFVSAKAGYVRHSVSRWERNETTPSMFSLIDWANALDMEITLTRRVNR
jgi:hypothetical protein